jgi:hypothetical protein
MSTLQRTLALIAVATITGCGGGSGSQTPVTPVVKATSAAVTRTPDAKATITLKFPAHVAKARPAATKAGAARKPAYINPNGASLVITYQGTPIDDPATGYAYFSLGTQDLTTGTSTVTVPLASGYYAPGDLAISEYDGAGTGNALAYGYNASYSDANGNYHDGSFTLDVGGTISPVITLAMNVAAIAITTDPVSGSDAQLVSIDYTNPTQKCGHTGDVFYFFPADLSSTIVLPGAPTGSGYNGGDTSNAIPGVPLVSLASQYSFQSPITSLNQSILGVGYVLNAPNVYGIDQVVLTVNNAIHNSYPYPPFTYSSQNSAYFNVGQDYC